MVNTLRILNVFFFPFTKNIPFISLKKGFTTVCFTVIIYIWVCTLTLLILKKVFSTSMHWTIHILDGVCQSMRYYQFLVFNFIWSYLYKFLNKFSEILSRFVHNKGNIIRCSLQCCYSSQNWFHQREFSNFETPVFMTK